ncbi:MAG: hypothetical protein ACE1ZF_04980, partial [Gemmatimonadales bacterium]
PLSKRPAGTVNSGTSLSGGAGCGGGSGITGCTPSAGIAGGGLGCGPVLGGLAEGAQPSTKNMSEQLATKCSEETVDGFITKLWLDGG